MSNHDLPRYYHLPLKTMEIIRPEAPEVTLATQRIFNLIELEAQRRIAHPEFATALTVLTRGELIQFKSDDRIVAKRTLDFADNTSIAPDPVDRTAYYYCYHDRGVEVDPPTHAVALFAHGHSENARIPVVPIHNFRMKMMLKRFPSLPGDSDPAETTEIPDRERHPNDLGAAMRTEGDIPLVRLDVSTVEAFAAIRNWVYTQDISALVEALLGDNLARAMDSGVYFIHEPPFGSFWSFYEFYGAACLSVESDYQDGSALTEAGKRVADIIALARAWELLNDDFWSVVLTLERLIPLAGAHRQGV